MITDEADNCDGTPIVSYIADTTDGGTNPETITRTYRVTDLTGNIVDVTQNILVSNFIISAPPSNVSTVAESSVSFSVAASNTNTYQWQVSLDGGSTFSDIINGAEYTGTQSTTLVLSAAAVSTSKNGYLYRVLVSNSASTCPEVASDSALLTIRSGMVITNRRITYRVKNN